MRKIDLATAISVGMNVWSLASRARDAYHNYEGKKYYYVSVPEGFGIYFDLMNIIHSGDVRGRSFKLHQVNDGIRRLYDSPQESVVNIAGYNFYVSVQNLDAPNDDSSFASSMQARANRGLVFRTKNPLAVDALEKHLDDMVKEQMLQERKPLRMIPSGGYWDHGVLPERRLESIILKGDEKESLVADLDKFLKSEENYLRMGIPWHRGYLLYGPPGNGKSSIIMALGHKFRRNIYVLSLSAVKDDETLNELISCVRDNAFVIIEDIDVFSDSVTREKGEKGPTLAGLLNALDGVFTPHGMITFMTTNRLEILDEALVRPGRVDYRMHLTAPDSDQIERAFQHIYGEQLLVVPRQFASMAEFIDIVKRNQEDSVAARAEIGVED